MKGAYFGGKGKIVIKEQGNLEPLANEVLIRNKACGVCGTDVHIYNGEAGSTELHLPVILGHEYSGVVERVGSSVTKIQAGDRVTVDPNIYCGACPSCRNGKKQLCDNMKAIGVNMDGGFADYSIVPENQVFRLKSDIAFEVGAMAEPLACCIHGIDLAEIKAGDTVLVVGGGAIGLIMVQLAKLSGAAKVVVSEPVAMRREIALSVGADACIDPINENPAERLRELTGKEGADVILECVGLTAATRQAFDCAAKGATLLLFSVPKKEASFDLPLFDVYKKELTIKGSFVNPDTHLRAVDLIISGKIQLEPLITHRFPVEELEQAIQMQMSAESVKVVVCTEI